MDEVSVGRSGFRVSPLSLGTLGWDIDVDDQTAEQLLASFFESGGTTIECSPTYGDGRTITRLGKALSNVSAFPHPKIALTVGNSSVGGAQTFDTSRGSILTSVEASLKVLGQDHVELLTVQGWEPDSPLSAHPPLEETLETLDLLVEQGKARYLGLSNVAAWQYALAATSSRYGITAVQAEYSLLQRSLEPALLPATQTVGAGIFARAPLGRGLLSGKYQKGRTPKDSRLAQEHWSAYMEPVLETDRSGILDAVQAAADGLGVTTVDIAIRWVLSQPNVSTVLAGPRTVEQLDQCLSATADGLPPEIVIALNDVSKLSA